jgi:hypothetical protein
MYAHDERCVHMHMCDPSPPIIVATTLTLYPSCSPPSLWCDSFIYNPPSSPDNLQLPVAVMELIAVAAVSLRLLDVERTFLNNCKMGIEALSCSSPTVSPHRPQIRRSSYQAFLVQPNQLLVSFKYTYSIFLAAAAAAMTT